MKKPSEVHSNAATRHDVVLSARTQQDIQVWIAREEIAYLSPQANEAKQLAIQAAAVIEDAPV